MQKMKIRDRIIFRQQNEKSLKKGGVGINGITITSISILIPL